MKTVRIWFEKDSRARFISHLDLNRFMPRALRRAKIPVWHTEGFNKHIYINFAVPLSMGYESKNDCFEIKIDEEQITMEETFVKLKDSMPLGIVLTGISEPVIPFKNIAFANYSVYFNKNVIDSDCVKSFVKKDTINVIRKTKSSEKEINLSEYMNNISVSEDDDFTVVNIDLPSGNDFIVKPSLLVDALCDSIGLTEKKHFRIVRNGFKTENYEKFI